MSTEMRKFFMANRRVAPLGRLGGINGRSLAVESHQLPGHLRPVRPLCHEPGQTNRLMALIIAGGL